MRYNKTWMVKWERKITCDKKEVQFQEQVNVNNACNRKYNFYLAEWAEELLREGMKNVEWRVITENMKAEDFWKRHILVQPTCVRLKEKLTNKEDYSLN